ncbi:IS1 family transposase [Flavobacterium sp. HNIBRBA15423]|uniref:IS1 family transposase n=1 Tax=Flavobacterium sp. HNIBRBA15423 TaxID=3458683 RepID=UPI004045096B
MRCYLKRKDKSIWIVYTLERKTKRIVSFSLRRRSKRTIQYVTNSLLLSFPKSIYTDGLVHYKSLVESAIHKVKRFGTNQIERNNLTMRTHLKRLQRKTICFSRSFILLQSVLYIYFLG